MSSNNTQRIPTFAEYLELNPVPKDFKENIVFWEKKMWDIYDNTYWDKVRNKPKQQDFKWTDELVNDYLTKILMTDLGREYNHMEKFKQSQLPIEDKRIGDEDIKSIARDYYSKLKIGIFFGENPKEIERDIEARVFDFYAGYKTALKQPIPNKSIQPLQEAVAPTLERNDILTVKKMGEKYGEVPIISEVVDEDNAKYLIISQTDFCIREMDKTSNGYYGYVKDGEFYQSKHKKHKHPKIKYAKQKDSIEDKAKQLANDIFLKVLSELDKNK